MRPITIIPTSPVVASTAGSQRPASSPSNPETNGRPFSNGTSNPSNPEPKLLTASPLSPSSSTTSIVSKKVLSKSESKTEVSVTKKPPPAAPKRSSLLSDSISKFEQNCDGAKPKVSWKSFIKPSPSKDKLAINGTNSSNNSNSAIVAAKETETTVDTASHEKKVKTLDENNNEVKSDEPTQPDEPAISNAKPILKPKPITNGVPVAATVVIESKSETHPEITPAKPAITNGVTENGTSSQPTTNEEPASLATSPPPVKVKRIVKKIIRRTVTKSSSDLSTLGGEQQEGEKVVKIIKKKVIKAKPVDVEIGEDALVAANQTSQAPVTADTTKPTKPTLPEPKSVPIIIEHKTPNPPEIITTIGSDQQISDSPSTLLNGKSPARPQIRPMLPAHRAHTIDLGSAQETILKLPPTPPTIIQTPSLLPKTASPSMDRRRSWGKLDKMPLSLALSRDSTLDDFSRESSLVSPRSTSPYSLSSTRSSSVLSNYESWQSSRSVTPRRLLSHSYHDSEDLSPLEHHHTHRLNPATRASPALSERSTASDYLSEKIEHFLKRTDYATQEWKRVGKSATNSDLLSELYGGTSRSKSVSSIMSRGLQLLRDSSRSSSRMSSVSRDSFQDCLDDDNRTVVDDNEVMMPF